MIILTWNIEWATPHSSRGKEISNPIRSHAPEVTCLTEVTLGILPTHGHSLSADGSTGYPGPADRRKVSLWSTAEWSDPDPIGHP